MLFSWCHRTNRNLCHTSTYTAHKYKENGRIYRYGEYSEGCIRKTVCVCVFSGHAVMWGGKPGKAIVMGGSVPPPPSSPLPPVPFLHLLPPLSHPNVSLLPFLPLLYSPSPVSSSSFFHTPPLSVILLLGLLLRLSSSFPSFNSISLLWGSNQAKLTSLKRFNSKPSNSPLLIFYLNLRLFYIHQSHIPHRFWILCNSGLWHLFQKADPLFSSSLLNFSLYSSFVSEPIPADMKFCGFRDFTVYISHEITRKLFVSLEAPLTKNKSSGSGPLKRKDFVNIRS